MKLEKKVKRTIEASVIIFAVGILLGAVITYAVTPSSTFYISSGVYPGAPSYTIWTEDDNIFAKDENGQLLSGSGGTNASEIIQNTFGDNRKILLKAGTYSLTVLGSINDKYALQIPYSNMVLCGEGSATVLKLADGEAEEGTWDSIIRVGNQADTFSNVVIKNLKIDGNNAGQSNKGIKGIIFLAYTQHCTVQNCILENINTGNYTYSGAIFGRWRSVWGTIKGNTIINAGHSGIYLTGVAHYVVANNHVKGCDSGEGIYVGSSNDTVVSNNVCEDAYGGVWSHGAYVVTCNRVTVTANILVNNTACGLHLGYTNKDVTVKSNVISNNNVSGILAQGSGQVAHNSYRVVISGNTVSNNNADGINLYHYYHTTVTSNVVFNNTENGINVSGNGTDIVVDGNIVYDNNQGGASCSGIYVHQDNTRRVVVSNNVVTNTTDGGHQKYGIYVFSSALENFVVDGNLVYGQEDHGIFLYYVMNCTVTSNICTDNGADGIRIGNCNHTTVIGNRCSRNVFGLNELASDYIIFVANDFQGNSGTNSNGGSGSNDIYQHNLD